MDKNYYEHEAVVPKDGKAFIKYATKPYRKNILGFFSITLVGVVAWQAAPFVISLIINELSESMTVNSLIWWLVGAYSFLVFLNEIAWRLSEYQLRRYAPQMIERVRISLFDATLNRSHRYFTNGSSGQIGHWINQSTDTFDIIMRTTAWNVWGNFTTLIVSALFLLFTHWSLALLFMVWLVSLFWFSVKRGKPYGKLVHDLSDEKSKAAGKVVDSVTNNVTVRAFNGKNAEVKHLASQQERIVAHRRKSWLFHTHTNAVKGQSTVLASALALILIVLLYGRGQVQVGDIVLFITYFGSAGAVLWDLAWAFDSYFSDFGTIQNAMNGLSGESEHSKEFEPTVKTGKSLSLELSSLGFSYPEQPNEHVLKGLNLHIKSGEKIGVVGHSGAGKSTLIGLLLGFYRPTKGTIFINGVDTASKDPSYIRSFASLVPQGANLFNRTIKENVNYAKPSATDEEIRAALKLAEADEFVEKLPNKIETLVGDRGVKLSGGQRQRIAIARAILRDAPLLLLDEATSALDSVSEQAIQKALHKLMKGRTAVVIAHRLSTLKHLDKIVVIEKGRVAEQGTHEELLKANGIYADLWKRQKDGFIVE